MSCGRSRVACAQVPEAGTVAGVHLICEGLARSGRLDDAGIEAVAQACGPRLPAGVLAQPQLVRTPEMLVHVNGDTLTQLLALEPNDAVLEQVLAGVPMHLTLCTVADREPSPRLMAPLVRAALAGQEVAAWVVLRAGPTNVRGQLVRALAPVVTDSAPRRWWTWLAAAVQCPDLLAGLVEVVSARLVPVVSRCASAVADGRDPVAVFAQEMVDVLAGGALPQWCGADSTGNRRPAAAAAVQHTGLEPVAEWALRECDRLDRLTVARTILAHPHLAGTPVARAAQEAVDDWVTRIVGADAVGVDAVSSLLANATGQGRIAWVGAGHDSPDQLEVVWRMLRQRTTRRSGVLSWDRTIGALMLMCADRPDGRVREQVATWLSSVDGVRLDEQALWAPTLTTLLDGVAGVPVSDLARVWQGLDRPRWLGQLVADFFAESPHAGDLTFVCAVLDLGEQFTGTFADLVATATAIAA